MDLTSEFVGRRVTLRYRVGDSATDVIGRVLSVGGSIAVERRDGSVVEVPTEAIIAGRVVPDRPVRSRPATAVAAEHLARITSRGWPALESEPLGEWELRAANGFTGRANSVLVTGRPGIPLDEAIGRVEAFYRSRGLPPLAQTVVGSLGETWFLEHGWLPQGGDRPGAIVQVSDLQAVPTPDPDTIMLHTPSDDWLSLYHRVGKDLATARELLTGPATVGFASVGDPLVAIGRVVVTGEWAGLSAMEVAPDHRRRGLARRLAATCLSWAAERGADKAYLQTMPDNHAALALYAGLGFTTHHEYRYLTAP